MVFDPSVFLPEVDLRISLLPGRLWIEVWRPKVSTVSYSKTTKYGGSNTIPLESFVYVKRITRIWVFNKETNVLWNMTWINESREDDPKHGDSSEWGIRNVLILTFLGVDFGVVQPPWTENHLQNTNRTFLIVYMSLSYTKSTDLRRELTAH